MAWHGHRSSPPSGGDSLDDPLLVDRHGRVVQTVLSPASPDVELVRDLHRPAIVPTPVSPAVQLVRNVHTVPHTRRVPGAPARDRSPDIELVDNFDWGLEPTPGLNPDTRSRDRSPDIELVDNFDWGLEPTPGLNPDTRVPEAERQRARDHHRYDHLASIASRGRGRAVGHQRAHRALGEGSPVPPLPLGAVVPGLRIRQRGYTGTRDRGDLGILTEDKLYIGPDRPPPLTTELVHQRCIRCEQVKSNPVLYQCSHSNCYVCTRLWLENDWSCPNCRAVMLLPPVGHLGEERSIAHDYPEWNNTSVVTYSWAGLTFPRRARRVQDSTPKQCLWTSTVYAQGGRTDGEGVERAWAALSPMPPSKRDMGPGRRQRLEPHPAEFHLSKL
ncbi:hypothetical protein B0H10DRAFT_2242454 [Mycena sp. CBHHK59/15]|nr:hypothetical protein B0H10DRAFT_2242454 [Mycena sp. CBHHK59/15]